MTLDGARTEEEPLGDLGITEILAQQSKHLELPRAEGRDPRCGGRQARRARSCQDRQYCLRLGHGLLVAQFPARRPRYVEAGIAECGTGNSGIALEALLLRPPAHVA